MRDRLSAAAGAFLGRRGFKKRGARFAVSGKIRGRRSPRQSGFARRQIRAFSDLERPPRGGIFLGVDRVFVVAIGRQLGKIIFLTTTYIRSGIEDPLLSGYFSVRRLIPLRQQEGLIDKKI